MDEAGKKKLAAAKKLIQEGKHAEALQDLQVMGYKYSKVFQVHLLMGLCYEKLKKYQEAQRAYLEVLDLNPNEPMALRQLCDLYTRDGDLEKGTKYLEQLVTICKKSDPKKYKELVIKLINLYEKDCNMQKIDPIFQQYAATEDTIGEDFVHIAKAYFKVGVTNQCFFLQKFEVMGVKGEQVRPVQAAAKEELNRLLIEVINYLKAVSLKYELTKKNIADSIMELKMYFPECASLLMLLLFDEFCVGQMCYSTYILGQLYYLCQAHFDDVKNYYHNLRYTSPETFAVCFLLAREYLCFFKQFFTLDPTLDQYYPKLTGLQDQLQGATIRDEYRKKIDKFILKECRQLNQLSKYQNIEQKLSLMKERIQALEGSYLEQIIAKIALHAFTNYDQLNDMKYKLKVRIGQIAEGTTAPHLYKYYYDYVIKMARVYKSLDEELPLREVLNYITQHDPNDYKYQLEAVWFEFSMQARTLSQDQRQQTATKAIEDIKKDFQKMELSLKSTALRRIMLIKLYTGNTDIQQEISSVLTQERSFENLQCAAVYAFWKGQLNQALVLVRQAYKINQNSYHINRLFFLCLYKNGDIKEAFAFLQHIHNAFNSVFWVNYYLGLNKINQQKFMEAQKLMIKAIEAFQAGSQDNFRFHYQKVYDLGPFSMVHLIRQNDYSIFFDEMVLAEDYIYKQLSIVSNLYFERDVSLNRMKLLLKEGQLLKILGRTKSSLNYLEDAYNESLLVKTTAQTDPRALFDHVLVRKEYATLLFYSCHHRQAQQMLMSAYNILQTIIKTQDWSLAQKLNDQTQALFFEISISRLSIMIKFQTQETITGYLQKFKEGLPSPKSPSLTFLKNQYQFHILQFMHFRESSAKVEQSVACFLKYFNMTFEERRSETFATRLQELGQAERKFVRQCIQDYYIVKSLCQTPKEEQLLHMITLFPRSSTLYVLFGSVAADIKLKTASFLKVIQLDKESAISMDILASLYLKQKNYLAATKLFLKSLQTDVLNPKCYLGLAICLFCLIVRAVEEGQKSQLEIVRQCLVRINSYMEFIRLNDPFQNYHLLSFLRLLLSDSSSHFNNKLILQAANRNCLRYRDTLLGQLLQDATLFWKDFNFWKTEHHQQIFQTYIKQQTKVSGSDHVKTALNLAQRAQKLSSELGNAFGKVGRQIGLKRFNKLLHQLGLSICLANQSGSRSNELFEAFIKACRSWEDSIRDWGFEEDELADLKQRIKQYLYDYILLGQWQPEMGRKVDCIFSNVHSYDHFVRHYRKFPRLEREIARQLMLNPANEQIRKVCEGYQVAVKGWNLRKAKLSHRLELHNNNNLNSTDQTNTYKKLFLLYRDPSATLLYISTQWRSVAVRSETNLKKWVQLLEHLLQRKEVQQNESFIHKAQIMRLQMLAFLKVELNVSNDKKLSNWEYDKYSKLIGVFQMMKKVNKQESLDKDIKNLSKLFEGELDSLDRWIFMSLITFIATKVKLSARFEQVLKSLSQRQIQASLQAFVLLTRFLLLLRKDTTDEDELIKQIMSLSSLSQQCQGKVSPTTELILECSRLQSAGSWDQMEGELGRAAQTLKVTFYSDQVLINFYELLKQYKTAENNPTGEGVIQSFIYLADSMLALIQEPLLQGFVLGLKGMVMSLAQGEERSIKMAMLMSPAASKRLFVQDK